MDNWGLGIRNWALGIGHWGLGIGHWGMDAQFLTRAGVSRSGSQAEPIGDNLRFM